MDRKSISPEEFLADIVMFNDFCRGLHEGDILYNIDTTNLWGEYLLVAAKTAIDIGPYQSWFVLLMGLDKKDEKLVPANRRINLTLDKVSNTAFLKIVGRCNFSLSVLIKEYLLDKGLVKVYESTDLWKYSKKLSVRKPKHRKYGKDGKPIIKPSHNE